MKKRKIIILAILLLLGTAFWFFSNRKAPATTENKEVDNTSAANLSDEKPNIVLDGTRTIKIQHF